MAPPSFFAKSWNELQHKTIFSFLLDQFKLRWKLQPTRYQLYLNQDLFRNNRNNRDNRNNRNRDNCNRNNRDIS